MFSLPVLAAFLAAFPSALASYGGNRTSHFTRCTTRFGYYPLPTGTADIPTWYTFIKTTQTFTVTTTLQDTITVAPIAPNTTTCAGIMTSTSTVTVTNVTTPAAVTVPASRRLLPLLIAAPTAAVKRNPHHRHRVSDGPELVMHPIKRQTRPGNTGGLAVLPDGNTTDLHNVYPHKVLCEKRWTWNATTTVTVTGEPTTVVSPTNSATVSPWSTSVVTTTVTVVEEAPTPKVYAACGGNNVVNHITDRNGTRMNFNRVVYRPQEGLPIANSMVVNTTNEVNCCGVCQETPQCAGSVYVPSKKQCHLRLIAPPSNTTFPTNGTLATGTATTLTFPTSTGTPDACPMGSNTLHIGTIRGMDPAVFKDEMAPYFSNGPCGRFTVSTVRLEPEEEAVEPVK